MLLALENRRWTRDALEICIFLCIDYTGRLWDIVETMLLLAW